MPEHCMWLGTVRHDTLWYLSEVYQYATMWLVIKQITIPLSNQQDSFKSTA